MKKIAVFLDGANSFYTQKKMGWKIDAEKLLAYCKGYGDIVEAIYYIGQNTGTDNSQQRYFDKLAYIGYTLVTKPIKTIHDHCNGKTMIKANLDVEIVLDMFNMIERYDMAILISGDGDFERALQLLKSRGKEIKVISTRDMVAKELVYTAGINYIDFLSIREDIELSDQPYDLEETASKLNLKYI